ncbi:SMP-30/gluconolactonase/LRE family protein [Acidisoma sp.]|uniref:SMP-30/gluconolactonase/LRE family protein n=1 Tax=Acidisoma sp. TaxID=1872115 RepID=UPI003B004B5F
MTRASPQLVWDCHCGTGETPTWDDQAGALYFCDIPGGRLHRFHPATEEKTSWQLPEVLGSFALCRSGRILVCQKQKLMMFDTVTQTLEPFAQVVEADTNRLNDGKVGPDGCFWVGTINEGSDGSPSGHLYRVTPAGEVEVKVEGLKNANGLAWTADGRTMFHSDTRGPWIDCWDFDPATGAISNRRRFADVSNEEGRPDGGALDVEGFYWSAGSGMSVINRFAPDGRLVEKVAMPVPNATMPAFAGDRLFITSALPKDEEARRKFPLGGGLFMMPVEVRGVPIGRFEDLRG